MPGAGRGSALGRLVMAGRAGDRNVRIGSESRLRELLDVVGRLATTFTRDELHAIVSASAATLVDTDIAMLRIVRGDQLVVAGSHGIDDRTTAALAPIPAAAGRLPGGDAAARAWACADLDLLPAGTWDPRFLGDPAVRAVLLVPIAHGGRLIGFIAAAARSPRAWTVDDIEVLTALGAHAALALHNSDLFERLEGRAAQLSVVQAASARMNRATTVAAVGRAIVEEVGAIVDYHNARVYVVEAPDDVVPIAFEGRVGAYETVDWDMLRTKVGEGFTGWVAANGVPLCIPDANADPRGAQIPGTDEVPESMLVVPMRHDDAVVGVITLSKLGLHAFDEDDLQVLSILADQAATSLESARLLHRTESLAVELRRLLDMSQELSQTLDPRQVGKVLARHLAVALGVDLCTISSWDRTGDRIVSLGEYPDQGELVALPTYDLASYPETRRVLESQVTVIVDAEDPGADEAEVAIMRLEGSRLLAMVPLIAKGQAVGLVELSSVQFIGFDAGRLALARTMANEAAMALENARLYDAARSLADRDQLTGFFNHRFLYERLGEEIVRARRGRRPLSLLMIDVDDFKLVNDTFGHQFGDRCLVALAQVVRSTLRASDVPARYGGDEFAVILPETTEEGAAVAAQRIIAELAANPVVADGRGPVPVDVSIGIATLGPTTRTPAEMVEGADASMYAAKDPARADDLPATA
jgi:diguanylate cyclase (GGDEF)-like protein